MRSALTFRKIWVVAFALLNGCARASVSYNRLIGPAVQPSQAAYCSGNYTLNFSGPSQVTAGACTAYTFQFTDTSGKPCSLSHDQPLSLSKTGGTFYSGSSCLFSETGTTIPSGYSGVPVYFADTVAGTSTLTAFPSPSTNILVTIKHGPAAQLTFTRQPYSAVAAISEIPVQVTIQDTYGNTVNDGPDATASMTLSRSSGTQTLNGNLNISAVAGIADFVFQKVNVPLNDTGYSIQATKASTTSSQGTSSLTQNSSSFDVTGNNMWFGSTATAQWMTATGIPAAGTGAGMFITQRGHSSIARAISTSWTAETTGL